MPRIGNNRTIVPPIDRFLTKIRLNEETGCWEWTASRFSATGYGQFYVGPGLGSTVAHKWGYEHFIGSVPAGLELDHLCRVRFCVNPEHLEPVTRQENLARSPLGHAAKTHCPQGHPYDEANTGQKGGKWRRCRICHAAEERKAKRWVGVSRPGRRKRAARTPTTAE